jgi:hypothetical protein
MDYKNKYIKYKNKYLQLKGGEPIFSIYTINETDELYHGSYNNITEKLKTPSFLSKDMLQSLGHIISSLPSTSETNLNKITSYFPIIYNYKPQKTLKLLKINKPYNTLETFDKIYNVDILWEFLIKEPNYINILSNFIDKITDLYPIYQKKFSEYNKRVYDYYIKKYKKLCNSSCFMGWVDTIGYYLLSNIDYNNYFKSIGICYENVEGFYIEQDQDSIILLNTDNIEIIDKYFVLPYFYKNKSYQEQKNFINKYLCFSKQYKINKRGDIYDLVILIDEYAYIDETKKMWEIDWHRTFCDYYNPLKDVYDKTKPVGSRGCAENLHNLCKKRFSNKIKIPDLEKKIYKEKCGNFKSQKISIDNLDYIPELVDYMKVIKSWNKNYFDIY